MAMSSKSRPKTLFISFLISKSSASMQKLETTSDVDEPLQPIVAHPKEVKKATGSRGEPRLESPPVQDHACSTESKTPIVLSGSSSNVTPSK